MCMPLDYCFHSQAALNIVKEEVAKNIREETKEQWGARLLKAYELPKKIIDKATAQMSLRVKDLDRANGKYTRWDHGGNAASR